MGHATTVMAQDSDNCIWWMMVADGGWRSVDDGQRTMEDKCWKQMMGGRW